MSDELTYKAYVRDNTFLSDYNKYQKRYRRSLRESDRKIVDICETVLKESGRAASDFKCLDIGCSTGNLLFHLKGTMPDLQLFGADLARSSIEQCKQDPELIGINFSEMDMLCDSIEGGVDVIIANAVLYLFDDTELKTAIRNIYRNLNENGYLVVYDFAIPFDQSLSICETSRSHPEGLSIHMRPFPMVEEIFAGAGFTRTRIEPFRIPIDLARGDTFTKNESGFEDLNTYTVKDDHNDRMMFRGALFQPWCHIIAQRG